jgi:tetratricopeptide (TPR) repeat protein
MRLAGCQRLSLGVESGSQAILDAIDKKITPAEIIESTELAKRFGIRVRYYMMLGNRGETRETFQETLRFLERAKPHEYIFSCLSIYPGTRDFQDAEAAGWLDREVYFTGSFQELKTPFDADEELTATLNDWFRANHGLRRVHEPSVHDCETALSLLGDHHGAHMDLAVAYFEAGRLDESERHARRAMELGYPCPGLALNHLACLAKARGDLDAMMDHFSEAARRDPQHYVLVRNVQTARAWFKQGGVTRKLPLDLAIRHDFQLLERTVQPTLPGPLGDDFANWTVAPAKHVAATTYVRTPDQEGSTHGLRGRLKVIASE